MPTGYDRVYIPPFVPTLNTTESTLDIVNEDLNPNWITAPSLPLGVDAH